MTVAEAETIIKSTTKDYGTEILMAENSSSRVLAEDIISDRPIPPFNRVTMDGIAICYESLNINKEFKIHSTLRAGQQPEVIVAPDQCIEIMTGSVLPPGMDTIIRYEDIEISNGLAKVLTSNISKGQNIHFEGSDGKQGVIIVPSGSYITPRVIGVAASVGKTSLVIKKHPEIIIISTGDEIIDPAATPASFELRSSNTPMIKAALAGQKIASTTLHLQDNEPQIIFELKNCLSQYDVLIITGGVSMGKFDLIPVALESLQVRKLFHKVTQRPGKPFWFGIHTSGAVVFAFPGNPVSVCMCLYRYFFPWVNACMGKEDSAVYATLAENVSFLPKLTLFLQVRLCMNEKAQLMAFPIKNNSSGDYLSLINTDGFLELPGERDSFNKGEVFRLYKC